MCYRIPRGRWCELLLLVLSALYPRAGIAHAQSQEGAVAATPPGDASDAGADVEVLEELSEVEGHLAAIESQPQQTFVVRSLVMVVAGYGTALIGASSALVTHSFAKDAQRWQPGDPWRDRLDINNDGSIDRDDEQAFRSMSYSFALIGVVGAGLGVVGSVLLAHDLRAQRAEALEVRDLRLRRLQLQRQLSYAPSLSPYGMGLSISGRF